jgi:hypothetical protein
VLLIEAYLVKAPPLGTASRKIHDSRIPGKPWQAVGCPCGDYTLFPPLPADMNVSVPCARSECEHLATGAMKTAQPEKDGTTTWRVRFLCTIGHGFVRDYVLKAPEQQRLDPG